MKWLWIVFFLIITPGASPVIQDVLNEPAVKYMKRWQPHISLGIIVTYETRGGLVQFAHPVMGFVNAPECKPMREENGTLTFMELGNNPVRYFTAPFATAYRSPPGNWKSVIKKTYED